MKFTSANTDAEIILSWLSNKTTNTRNSYEYTVKQFMVFIDKSLIDVKIEDLQLWIHRLKLTYKPVTIANKVLYIKSLFSFCHQVGYLSINFASLIRTPRVKNELSNKILSISEVKALLEAARNNQEKAILSLMYGCGLRVSEVAYLMWTDLKEDRLTVYGKGEKQEQLFASFNS
ncbi:MAG: tyrosine-type recombinase/integrase [Hydrococcus sp. SU_1_0]|nr:tyrosine-type recombinase/integrase [Hydrococcus sp. SU_1_0]